MRQACAADEQGNADVFERPPLRERLEQQPRPVHSERAVMKCLSGLAFILSLVALLITALFEGYCAAVLG
jgi:hypothetical protein